MNEGIHLDLDTWIVPGQIRKANLCRGLGNRYTPALRSEWPFIIIIIKPFVCICKRTATGIGIWWGCPAEVGHLTLDVSWPSALHCNPCPTNRSHGNVPTRTPATMMDIPSVKTGQQIYTLLLGAAQLDVGYLTVSASRPLAFPLCPYSLQSRQRHPSRFRVLTLKI